MNQKLDELSEQSTTYIQPTSTSGEGWIFDKEKFAQLIVRECGVALSPMLRDMVSRGHAYDLIKQHFGVEE